MSVYDTRSESTREAALEAANTAVREGRLIVLPTDTVYGIGADAFRAEAVGDLLAAKGRGRDVPPPVLVGDPAVLFALATDIPEYVERLTEEFWPGALTIILNAQPQLAWDLGETRGTVALRMPDDEVALELLRRTGPLAVSSANRHGKDAALSVLDAATQLGDAVDVYLDGGTARIGTASTIIDATVQPPEIVREGALTREQIIAAVGDIFTAPVEETEDEPAAEEPGIVESATDEPAAVEPAAEAPAPSAPDPAPADPAPSAPAHAVVGAEDPAPEPAPARGPLDLPREADLSEPAVADADSGSREG